jgi:hypothetical protein
MAYYKATLKGNGDKEASISDNSEQEMHDKCYLYGLCCRFRLNTVYLAKLV